MRNERQTTVGEDSISSRKQTPRTNHTPTDERAMRTDFGLLYANGRSIQESTLQMVGGSRTILTATDAHPFQNHNSPAANYITFFFRKTNNISAGNISRAPRAHIAPRQAKNQKYHCTVGVFAGNIRLISEKGKASQCAVAVLCRKTKETRLYEEIFCIITYSGYAHTARMQCKCC